MIGMANEPWGIAFADRIGALEGGGEGGGGRWKHSEIETDMLDLLCLRHGWRWVC